MRVGSGSIYFILVIVKIEVIKGSFFSFLRAVGALWFKAIFLSFGILLEPEVSGSTEAC